MKRGSFSDNEGFQTFIDEASEGDLQSHILLSFSAFFPPFPQFAYENSKELEK